MLCPFNCGICREAECRSGCLLTGEPMLESCHLCGEIMTPISRIVICLRCTDDALPADRRQPARAR